MTEGARARLAFSTLGCPEWDAERVVAAAATYGFDGIEWRGGPGGTVGSGWPTKRRRALALTLARAGVSSIAVTSYPNLISGDRAERARSVIEIIEHVALANDLGAPVVRVFVGIQDDRAGDDALHDRAVAGLAGALDATSGSGVTLAIEPHDAHVRAEAIQPILAAIPDARLRIVWDVANAWAAGEAPETGLAAYAGRIAYMQVKDGRGRGAGWQLCALGEGDVPLDAALDALAARASADGAAMPPISFEWERAWHPSLAPPEIALPAARRWIHHHLGACAFLPRVAGAAPGAPGLPR
jgi:sugar phosphate isomerase/epimerase